MNLETNSILNLGTTIVSLNRDNQINIISLNGTYQLDYNFEILVDVQRNQTYQIRVNDLQPISEIEDFESFYNEDVEFSYIELTFSTNPDY